ncbi:MAG: hypothetical protein ACTSQG_08555, partial [Promethearchaeota archaeon]
MDSLKRRIKMKFLKAISVNEFKKILDAIPKLDLEEEVIPLENSLNRTLAKDIKSKINVPHFRKSRMDGYALIAEDTFGADEDNIISLDLIETIQAGDIPQKKIFHGQCAYVATGAALPDQANGVVMIEFTEREGKKVEISKAITPGTYVIEIGHDVKKGDLICKKGSIIGLATIGILAACGINKIPVYKKPSVSL